MSQESLDSISLTPATTEDYFCLVPWHSTFVAPDGTIRPCCISDDILGDTQQGDSVSSVWNSPASQKLRHQFLSGTPPKGCSKCYKKEALFNRSHRMQFNKSFLQSRELDISKLETQAPLDLLRIDYSFSNTCNLKCRFCGPWNSTSWFKDADKLASETEFTNYLNTNKVIQNEASALLELAEQSPYLDLIELKGGEPFMSTELMRALESLVQIGRAKNIRLHICSNGTHVPPKAQEILSQFKKIELNISVEATGSLYQYLRGGTVPLEQIEKNMALFNKLPNIDGSVHMAFSAYSLFEPVNVYDWLQSLELAHFQSFSLSAVVSPNYLNPTVLPLKVRQRAAARMLNHSSLRLQSYGRDLMRESSIDKNSSEQSALFSKLQSYTRHLDRIRNVHLRDAAPDMAQIVLGDFL
jgi:MoaA/NifB/PqqE/SkfB family radical SAM enzyme